MTSVPTPSSRARLWTVIWVCGVACSFSIEANASEVAGTYELLVCKTACSFADPDAAFAKGIVVLFDKAMTPKEIERVDPSHFVWPNEVVRACFAGQNFKGADSFAFGERVGATHWSLQGKLLNFELLRSVDAGYEVDVERDGRNLVGKGTSWGAGVAAPGFSSDIVVGRRIGPPDISACPSTPPYYLRKR